MSFNHQPGSPARLGPTNPGTLERNGETLTYVARPQDPTAQANQRLTSITSRQEYRIGLQQPLQFNAQAYSVHPSVLGQFRYQPLTYGFGLPRGSYQQVAPQYQSPMGPSSSAEPFLQFVQAPGGSTGAGGVFGRLPDPNPTVPDVSRFGFTSPLHRVTPVTPPGPSVVDWANNPRPYLTPPSVYVDQFGQPLRIIRGVPPVSSSTNQGMNFGSPGTSPSTSTGQGTNFGPNAQSSSPSSTVSSTQSQLQTRQKELQAELTKQQAEAKEAQARDKALIERMQKLQRDIAALRKQTRESQEKLIADSAAIRKRISEAVQKAAKTNDNTGVPELVAQLEQQDEKNTKEMQVFVKNLADQLSIREELAKELGEQSQRLQTQIKTATNRQQEINKELARIQSVVKTSSSR